MSLATTPVPAPPASAGTYEQEDTLTENYTTTADTTTGDISLGCKISWPTVDDPTIPRFLVVQPITSGWASSDFEADMEQSEWVVGMGGICVALQCRVNTDSPLSTGDADSHGLLRRSIRAPVFDTDAGLKYILENYLEGDGDTMPAIEPSWIFVMGSSAGGVTANIHSQTYPTRRLCGLIVNAAGYGMDDVGTSPDTATDIVRDQLKFSYRYHKIPTCAFLGGADTTLGADRVAEFRAHLNTRPDSIAHYDSDGGHASFGDFDVTALTDADTQAEAVYNFISRRCAATQPTYIARTNFRAWGRSWVNLQSRFW